MSINSDLKIKILKPIIITVIKLTKKIDKLYLGFNFCDRKNVTQATIIENNNSKTYMLGFLNK